MMLAKPEWRISIYSRHKKLFHFGPDFSFVPNVEFCNYVSGTPSTAKSFFCDFSLSYLKHCMSLDDDYIAAFSAFAARALDFLETTSGLNGQYAPVYHGVFIGRKNGKN